MIEVDTQQWLVLQTALLEVDGAVAAVLCHAATAYVTSFPQRHNQAVGKWK